MRIEIIGERDNPLLNRREIRARISYEGPTPTFREVREELVKELKSKNELTVLNNIKTRFGNRSADCYVKVYKDKKSMSVEPSHRLARNFEEKKVGREVEEKKAGEAIEERDGEAVKKEESKKEDSKGEKNG